jgi:hypothetical protein
MPSRYMRSRVVELERRLPAPPIPEDAERKKRRHRVQQRLDRLCQEASRLLTEEQARNVQEALKHWDDARWGPYARWFRELLGGRCRLPELAPPTMKELLLAWLSPDCDNFTSVCRGCGLLRPNKRSSPWKEWKLLPGKVPLVGPPPWYDVPVFFEGCPGCGASANDMDWSHLVDGVHRPWMKLDGYVGLGVSNP